MSLGFGFEHKVSDGVSSLHFINTWSEIASGLTPAVPPSLDRRLLSPRNPPRPQFPHIEHQPPPTLKTPISNSDDTTFSTFRLSADQIKALKQKCKTNDSTYTTYEVVAGHLWRCATIARGLPKDQETKLQLPVNVRRRLQPPLPPGYFGNAISYAVALSLCGELESRPLRCAVETVHEAIARMGDEYVRSMLDYLELNLPKNVEGIVRGERHVKCPNFGITSWLQLPFYGADFGWGKPVYSGPGVIIWEGRTVLMADPQSEGGVLLVITLHKHAMKRFEKLLYSELFTMSKI